MEQQFLKYLEYEKQILLELIDLAKRQQKALVNFDINSLEEITSKQDKSQSILRKAEDARIRYVCEWFGIERTKASYMRLSELAELVDKTFSILINNYKDELYDISSELYSLNTTNRILANRAKHSVNEMMNIFTKDNAVCNVKI
jgi:hypothetical protein